MKKLLLLAALASPLPQFTPVSLDTSNGWVFNDTFTDVTVEQMRVTIFPDDSEHSIEFKQNGEIWIGGKKKFISKKMFDYMAKILEGRCQ